ncbi:MAG: hypothetical protein MUF84_04325 [Anaerolineae bacterium]|jgi:hypothetical protein|nr:hypothetical protein [Anaerolineae bacterium]
MRHRDQAYTVVSEPSPSLGQRLGRFFGLLGALFAIAFAVIVTQRLSHDSLALLIGLSCGIAAMLPTLALGLFIWRRDDARRQAQVQAPQQPAYPATPPVIVVTPQALPGYGQQPAFGPANVPNPWVTAPTERAFKIVGGDD